MIGPKLISQVSFMEMESDRGHLQAVLKNNLVTSSQGRRMCILPTLLVVVVTLMAEASFMQDHRPVGPL